MATSDTHHNRSGRRRALPPELFDAVVTCLLAEHPDDETGRMLRSPGLKTSGRFYAFATGTDLVVKLPAGRVAALIRGGVGSTCDPRGGRPMREWVRLAPPDADTATAFVRDARAFVAG